MSTELELQTASEEGKPIHVETDKSKWPVITGDTDLNRFHGVGALRERGYDVNALYAQNSNVVFEKR